MKRARPIMSSPWFSGCNPSTSFNGEVAFCSSKMSIGDSGGNGDCTMMPCTFGSAFNRSINDSASSKDASAARNSSNATIPHSAAALYFIPTYIFEAGSSPISTSTKPGVTPARATRSATSLRTCAAIALPSMMRAATAIRA